MLGDTSLAWEHKPDISLASPHELQIDFQSSEPNGDSPTYIRQRIAAVFKRDVFHLWTGSHLVITFPACPQLAEHQPTESTSVTTTIFASVATALASSLCQAARRPATLFT